MTIIKNRELSTLKRKKIKYFSYQSFIVDWTKEHQEKVYEKEISMEFLTAMLLFIFGGEFCLLLQNIFNIFWIQICNKYITWRAAY